MKFTNELMITIKENMRGSLKVACLIGFLWAVIYGMAKFMEVM